MYLLHSEIIMKLKSKILREKREGILEGLVKSIVHYKRLDFINTEIKNFLRLISSKVKHLLINIYSQKRRNALLLFRKNENRINDEWGVLFYV